MFVALLALMVLGPRVIVLLPDTRAARVAIYVVIIAGMLFFVALISTRRTPRYEDRLPTQRWSFRGPGHVHNS